MSITPIGTSILQIMNLRSNKATVTYRQKTKFKWTSELNEELLKEVNELNISHYPHYIYRLNSEETRDSVNRSHSIKWQTIKFAKKYDLKPSDVELHFYTAVSPKLNHNKIKTAELDVIIEITNTLMKNKKMKWTKAANMLFNSTSLPNDELYRSSQKLKILYYNKIRMCPPVKAPSYKKIFGVHRRKHSTYFRPSKISTSADFEERESVKAIAPDLHEPSIMSPSSSGSLLSPIGVLAHSSLKVVAPSFNGIKPHSLKRKAPLGGFELDMENELRERESVKASTPDLHEPLIMSPSSSRSLPSPMGLLAHSTLKVVDHSFNSIKPHSLKRKAPLGSFELDMENELLEPENVEALSPDLDEGLTFFQDPPIYEKEDRLKLTIADPTIEGFPFSLPFYSKDVFERFL